MGYFCNSSGNFAIFTAIRRASSRAKLAQANNVLAEIRKTIERRCSHNRGQMDVTFTYRCPRTGLHVQGRIVADHPTNCEIYEPVTCTACAEVHLVNAESGKVLETPPEKKG